MTLVCGYCAVLTQVLPGQEVLHRGVDSCAPQRAACWWLRALSEQAVSRIFRCLTEGGKTWLQGRVSLDKIINNATSRVFPQHSAVSWVLTLAPSSVPEPAVQDRDPHRTCYTCRRSWASVFYLLVWTQYRGVLFVFNTCISWIVSQFKIRALRFLFRITERSQFHPAEIGARWCASRLPTVLDNVYFAVLAF